MTHNYLKTYIIISICLTSPLLTCCVDIVGLPWNYRLNYDPPESTTFLPLASAYSGFQIQRGGIKNIIDAGHKEKIWVGMCGEMAGEPGLVLILLGLGLDEFSMSPAAVPEMKYIIRNINFKDAKEAAEEALSLPTGEEVESFINKRLNELIPGLKKMRSSA